jgi:uncharacterized membrane protein
MIKLILILLIALVFEAGGVIFLSVGLKQIGQAESISRSEITRLVRRGATNFYILMGVLFEAVFFAALLYLMSQSQVSFIWPLTSLGFVLTTLAARFILNETVTFSRWMGVVLIMAGAMLITYSEKKVRAAAPELTPPASPR